MLAQECQGKLGLVQPSLSAEAVASVVPPAGAIMQLDAPGMATLAVPLGPPSGLITLK